MRTSDLEYYKIDLGQIWYHEASEYILGKISDESIRFLKERFEELIVSTYLQQINEKRNNKSFHQTIIPVVTLSGFNEKQQPYALRQINELKKCRSLSDFIEIGLFTYQGNVFSHEQTIYISPKLIDFEFWFALKIKQYECGLKFLKFLLEFNSAVIFKNNFKGYKSVLDIILAQYSREYFSNELTVALKDWIAIYSKNNNSSSYSNSTNEMYETFVSDEVFLFGHSKLSKQVDLDYRTFFLKYLLKNRSLFDPENSFFVELIEFFQGMHSTFLHSNTTYDQFISLFKPADIKPEEKIIWIGTLFELYWFIRMIEKREICAHLGGTAKWKIALLCFNLQINRGEKKGEIIEITSFKRISDASGTESLKTDKLTQLTLDLKRIIENAPKV